MVIATQTLYKTQERNIHIKLSLRDTLMPTLRTGAACTCICPLGSTFTVQSTMFTYCDITQLCVCVSYREREDGEAVDV